MCELDGEALTITVEVADNDDPTRTATAVHFRHAEGHAVEACARAVSFRYAEGHAVEACAMAVSFRYAEDPPSRFPAEALGPPLGADRQHRTGVWTQGVAPQFARFAAR